MNPFLSWKAEITGPAWLSGVLPALQRRAGVCPLPAWSSLDKFRREGSSGKKDRNKQNKDGREKFFVLILTAHLQKGKETCLGVCCPFKNTQK